MKTTNLLIFSFLSINAFGLSMDPTGSDQKEPNPQGSEYRLQYLYKQRDTILGGLDNLARNTCMNSRFADLDDIKRLMQSKSDQDIDGLDRPLPIEDDPEGLYLAGEGSGHNRQIHKVKPSKKLIFILPRAIRKGFEGERQRSFVLNRWLKPELSRPMAREKDANTYFAEKYYRRTQCIAGDGLKNACALLSKNLPGVPKEISKLGKAADQSKKLFKRFDLNKACAAYEEKAKYRNVLVQVQAQIDQLEKEKVKLEPMPDKPLPVIGDDLSRPQDNASGRKASSLDPSSRKNIHVDVIR